MTESSLDQSIIKVLKNEEISSRKAIYFMNSTIPLHMKLVWLKITARFELLLKILDKITAEDIPMLNSVLMELLVLKQINL